MVFGFGNVYMWTQTLITFALYRITKGEKSSFLMVCVRLVLSMMATTFFITSKHHGGEGYTTRDSGKSYMGLKNVGPLFPITDITYLLYIMPELYVC